jgi:acetyltransferase-like isoleucine patch superfamily enzyme
MTFANQLFSYFPLLMTILTFAALGVFAHDTTVFTLLLVLAVLYVFPPIVQRILLRWTPLKPGISVIDSKTFSPWLAMHHIQGFYDALPQLESLLRVIPGFYSMWLRLWGSRVGYGVEWPVRMQVLDRSLMDIGNRVVFSRSVQLAAHLRSKSEAGGGASKVLVRVVRIGGSAFIGAGVRTLPGASVPGNASVPEHARIGVNEMFGSGPHHPAPEEATFAAG